MLSGGIFLTAAFLYWLLQRQTEYDAGRNAIIELEVLDAA